MLSKTTKTASELEIEQWELDGLLAFCRAIESGQLQHRYADEAINRDLVFDMDIGADSTECGTACCIGGYIYLNEWRQSHANEMDAREAACDYLDKQRRLGPLFYPRTSAAQKHSFGYGDVTPLQAARCVRHFLETGEIDASIMIS
jgi:hypothetical protein